MATVDRFDLPLTVTTHAAYHNEVTLVQLNSDFTIEARPETLIGNRAYYTDKLNARLREQRAAMISPHRSNRTKTKTLDGRRVRCNERRWIVWRFFARLQWQRRLLVHCGYR